jgi:hypothetical protein
MGAPETALERFSEMELAEHLANRPIQIRGVPFGL